MNYHKIRHYLLGALLVFGVHFIYAQDFLTGLGINAQIAKEAQKQNLPFHKGRTDSQPFLLPFFEDFSNYTGYPDDKLFVDKQAFVNQSFSVFPPTIGAVTLDALDEYGKIYSHLNEVSKGADTLTSRYIRLDSLFLADTIRRITIEDSLYFSFYFQPGGAGITVGSVGERIGNQPDKNDSLVLEFGYRISETDTITIWNHIWSTPGFSVDEWISDNPHQYFKQVMIPIVDDKYLRPDFQFRFRNYASLEPQPGMMGWQGNVDQWHIDYIRLDVNRNVNDVFTNDLAFVSPTTSFLKNYQAMPWKQFQPADMKSNFSNQLTNLSDGKRTPIYKYDIAKSGNLVHEYTTLGAWDIDPYYTHGLYKNDIIANPPISYTPHLTDTTTFKITHIFTNNSGVDFCTANDTCVFEQKFMDYYAYDDGTAEYGYCLNNQYNIARLAMKFSLRIPDSLSAVRMWFNHTKNSENEAAQFAIVVWKDNNGLPGDTLYTTKEYKPKFDSLQFRDFVEYRFDKKVFISEANKNFWIGFEQHGNVQLNIGFDQNNDSREFFRYNTNGNWEKSAFKGTPMMRPAFGEPVNLKVTSNPEISKTKIYPNPTSGQLRITNYELRITNVEVFDVFGRKIFKLETQNPESETNFDISSFPIGIYFVRIQTEKGMVTEKIIKY